jgi:hypothetical protein
VSDAARISAAAWSRDWWAATHDAAVITTDGPLPGDVDPERVRAARAALAGVSVVERSHS